MSAYSVDNATATRYKHLTQHKQRNNTMNKKGTIRAALADLTVCAFLFAAPFILYYIALGADAMGVK